MAPRRNPRPCKAPIQATEKGSTILSVGHRKDNAEWGKRMEKTLAQMDKRREAEQEKTRVNPYPRGIKLMSEREADECSRISGDGQVERWSSESEGDALPIKDTILPKTIEKEAVTHKDVGLKIARDFGGNGVLQERWLQ
jgi:hypothetical protein